MQKPIRIIYVLFIIAMFFSCEKEEFNEDYLWYWRAQTGCANPWESYSGQSSSDLRIAVRKYLNEMDIEHDKVVVGFDSIFVQYCFSCGCTTGKFVEVHAAKIHEQELEEIGFKEVLPVNNE